jgi:hypothetical protein
MDGARNSCRMVTPTKDSSKQENLTAKEFIIGSRGKNIKAILLKGFAKT